MKNIFAKYILSAVIAAAGFFLDGADLTLVNNGKAVSEIIIGKNPTQSASLGAYELQYHIRKITDTELPILNAPSKADNVKIYIGDLPDGKKEKFSGEKIVRRFENKNIILTGNDTSLRKKFDYNNPDTFPFGLPQEEYGYNGPLFAVYDFLEDLCDVRFFYYNDKGTSFPRKKTLSVKTVNREHTPKFNAFRIITVSKRRDVKFFGSLRNIKLYNLRSRQAQFYGNTNHNGYSIYFTHWGKAKRKTLQNSFKVKRKDFFAQGYDGQGPMGDPIIRSNYTDDKDCPAQLCYSNPGTIKYFADEVMTYYNGGCVKGGWLNFHGRNNPADTLIPRFEKQPFFYPVEPGDSQKDKVCLCAACKKRVAPGATDISDHKFKFIADIADEVAKKAPDAGVSTLAYIRSLYYPKNVNLPPNISVQLCLPFYSWWHPVAYAKQHTIYKEWAKKEAKKRPLTLWTYMFNAQYDADVHFGKYKTFPNFYPEFVIDTFKEFSADGIRGWFTEIVRNQLFMEAYLASRICYDDSMSKEQLLNDYYTKCYGKAAGHIRAFYSEIEKNSMSAKNCPSAWLKDKNTLVGPKGIKHPYWSTGLWSADVNWKIGTPARMKKLSALLEKAEKSADTDCAKFMVSKLREIWNSALEGHRQYYEFARLKHSRTAQMQQVADANGNAAKIDWSKLPKSDIFTDSQFKKVKRNVFFRTAYDSKFVYFNIEENEPPAKNEDKSQGHGFEMIFSKDGYHPQYYLLIEPTGKYHSLKFVMESDVIKKEIFDFTPVITPVVNKNSWNLLVAIPKNKLPFSEGQLVCNMIRVRPNKDYAVWNATGSYDCRYKLEEAGRIIAMPFAIRSNSFTYADKRKTREEHDSASENGFAGSLDFGYSWGLQANIPAVFNGKYDIDVYIKSTEIPQGNSFRLFVYDKKIKKIVAQKNVNPKLVSGKKNYTPIHISNVNINSNCYVTVSAFSKKTAAKGKIFIEKLIISTPQKKVKK